MVPLWFIATTLCTLTLKQRWWVKNHQNTLFHCVENLKTTQDAAHVPSPTSKSLKAILNRIIKKDFTLPSEHHGVFCHVNCTPHNVTCLPRISILFISLMATLGLGTEESLSQGKIGKQHLPTTTGMSRRSPSVTLEGGGNIVSTSSTTLL